MALEVLLAVCIEEPRPSGLFDGSELFPHYGTAYWNNVDSPMYFRGPYLAFLRQCPEQGLSFVLRLVNFATKRWADGERTTAEYCSDPSPIQDMNLGVQFRVGEEERLWLGDIDVLRWHSDSPRVPGLISCALMALEKWLYDEIEAGRDVSRWTARILAEGESLAFVGLLLDVGKRHPDLFRSQLRDLLSSWEVYYGDYETVAARAEMNLGMVGWWREPEELVNLARDWFTAPYRRYLLERIAVWLLQDEEMRPFFASLRERWSKMLDPEGRPRDLRLLIERLNPPNYRLAKGADGNEYLAFEWPEELREKTEQEATVAGQQAQFLGFPFRCRGILDGKVDLAQGDLDSLWEELTRIVALSFDDRADSQEFASRRWDAVCGGAAVLVCRHRDWLRTIPAREQWCLAQLVGALERRPTQPIFSVHDSIGEHYWDVFVGEAGVALLAEDKDDETARRLVAAGVMAFHHSATRQTVRCAFSRRRLGVPFEQIHDLALAWAAVRCMVARSERLETDTERWRRWKSRLLEAFVHDRLPSFSRRLGRLNRWGVRALDRIHEKRYLADGLGTPWAHDPRQAAPRQLPRETPGVDVSVLTAAFSWLDLLDLGLPADRQLLLEGAQDLLRVLMQGLPERAPKEAEPRSRGRSTISIVGCSGKSRGQSRLSIALKIASLYGNPFSTWEVLDTAGSSISSGSGSPKASRRRSHRRSFVSRWQEMVEYALRHQRWNPGAAAWYHLDDMVDEMLGFRSGAPAVAADERYATAIGGMIDIFARLPPSGSVSRISPMDSLFLSSAQRRGDY